MTVVTKNVGRLPGYPASPEYDSQTAYGRKQRCVQYGCEIESLVDNNTYAPFTWDGDETFTLDDAHWRLISGNPKVWAAGNPKPAASEEYPYNGMGRVVIPKNMVNDVNTLTQDAFEDGEGNPLTNTVFVIQYDFTLGEDITIPEKCVLEFDGGSLSNGKILCNDLRVVTNTSGIFDNVTFGGSCVANTICKLDWFIKQYPESDNDYSVDNTNEVKDCFASGFRGISFPRKFIHLTETITCTKPINIYTDEEDKVYAWRFHPTDKKQTKPCVFSRTVVTLFDYQINNVEDDSGYIYSDTSLYIGKIQLFIKKDFSNVDDINVPVINITPITNLWGVVIDADILIRRCHFTVAENHSGWFFNYTGIKIATSPSTGYCSFVRINGNIVGANYGVYFHGEANNTPGWFTDVIIYGNTQCCYGGVFDNVTPVSIYGNHQCAYFSHEQTEPEGYFTGNIIRLYGYVWDTNKTDSTSGFKTASLRVKLLNVAESSFDVAPKTTYAEFSSYPEAFVAHFDPLKDLKPSIENALYRAVSPRNDNNFYIYNFSYLINGVSLLKNYTDVFNTDNLFNDHNLRGFISRTSYYVNDCYVRFAGNKALELSFSMNEISFNITNGESDFPQYLFWQQYDNSVNVTVKIYKVVDGEEVVYYSYSGNGSYYNGTLNKVRIPYITGLQFKITCSTTNDILVLPTVIIPFYGHRDKITISSSQVDKPKFNSQERYGAQCYDLQSKVLNIWDGNNWYNSLGIKASVPNYGTFANKPSAADIPVGFRYFCTDKQTTEGATNGIEIIHKGNDVWVDALGRVVS